LHIILPVKIQIKVVKVEKAIRKLAYMLKKY